MKVSSTHRLYCPKCGSFDIRSSYQVRAWDTLLRALFSLDAFRCRACRGRFHKHDRSVRGQEERPTAARDDISRPDPAR